MDLLYAQSWILKNDEEHYIYMAAVKAILFFFFFSIRREGRYKFLGTSLNTLYRSRSGPDVELRLWKILDLNVASNRRLNGHRSMV